MNDAKLGEFGAKSGTIETETAKKRLEEERLEEQRAARTAAAISAADAAAKATAEALEGLSQMQEEESQESQELLEESSEAVHELDHLMAEMKEDELKLYHEQSKLEEQLKELRADPNANPDEIKDLEYQLQDIGEAQDAYIDFELKVERAVEEAKEKETELKENQRALNERADALKEKIEKEGLTPENKTLQNDLDADREKLNAAQSELSRKIETIKQATTTGSIYGKGVDSEHRSSSEIKEDIQTANEMLDFHKKLDQVQNDTVGTLMETMREQDAIEQSNPYGIDFDGDGQIDDYRSANETLSFNSTSGGAPLYQFSSDVDLSSDLDTDKDTPEDASETTNDIEPSDVAAAATAEGTVSGETTTTDKQEPIEVAAATGAVSGETETTTGDADQWSGTESQELNTSEEYQAALTGEGGIYGQIENGQISEAALDKVPEHLRPQVLAALERDNIEVVKPENSPGQESQIPGIDVADAGQIKNFLADTLGAENAEITMNTASAAMIAAFPFLAAFRGPEIADPQDQPSAHGISYGGYKSFADNEFRETDEPGVDASYNVPAAYAQNAQDVSNTFHASHDNQPTAGADGSGDSSSSTQDLEAQAQEQLLAAQRAQQQMQQMMPGNDGPNEPKPDDGFMA